MPNYYKHVFFSLIIPATWVNHLKNKRKIILSFFLNELQVRVQNFMKKSTRLSKLNVYAIFIVGILNHYSSVVQANDSLFYRDVHKWFTAWELVSKDVYHVNKLEPVDFVFFDEKYLYATSAITIPEGETINGPQLFGEKYTWKKVPLQDSITLPDKRRVPVNLMSFASPLKEGKKQAFFIMPLLSFWEQAGVKSEELGLDNLITAVFLHEFSHSQQMQNFGKRITELDNKHNFGIMFSDDIVQNLFDKDSVYVNAYKKELDIFYKALSQINNKQKRTLIKAGINKMKARHNQFLSPKNKDMPEIDEFFLTMEGIGQYSQYAWLIHKQGANLPIDKVIAGMRRGGRWWSQDEGMVLFLLLAQLSPSKNWAASMFGIQTVSIVSLLNEELTRQR